MTTPPTRRRHPRHATRAPRRGPLGAALAAAVLAVAVMVGVVVAQPRTATEAPVAGAATEPRSGASAPGHAAKAPTPRWHPWGPSAAEVAAATDVARGMSDAELAGQLIVGRLHGTDPTYAGTLVSELNLAGVMVTGQSVQSLWQVRALTDAVHQAVAGSGRDWPALVSTDNEGGAVQRMSGRVGPWTTYPAFAEAGKVGRAGVLREAYAAMAAELRASGVTVNWAPVADVTVPGEDAVIRSRAAGDDPETVAAAVVPALDGFLAGGVLPSAKHFPGHGALGTDSHHGLPVLRAGQRQLERRELPPFEAAVEAGVPMVMLGHVDVRTWDPGVPASVSPEAYRVLREELAFAGVTVTDSLGMGALNEVGDAGEVAVAALSAGADLLLAPADNHVAHAGVVAALQDGTLARADLEAAAGRVIAMMRHQQELAEQAGAVGPADVGSAADAARALREAAERADAAEPPAGRLLPNGPTAR